MAGINKAILIGRLGKDPECKPMASGDLVCTFSIATSETWKDKQTGDKREQTEWHKVVAYRGLAQIVSNYLGKGSQVYIEGKIQTRKWQHQDGTDRYSTEIVANQLQMLDGRGQQGQAQAPTSPEQASYQMQAPAQDGADDIPF
jgi:single-strand DNA-binding protein